MLPRVADDSTCHCPVEQPRVPSMDIFDASVFQRSREVRTRELAALVGVEDRGASEAMQGFLEGLNARTGTRVFDRRHASTL